ncbi:MAG: COX15/CtaA family protein [Flavobacteriaceae bacterium]|nr:COX15/CtaA family protein [Flavobacteriaceae bacterium]MCY4161182.1 COX15/CtaA family protein [Flavobacteriaceae bacterium]MCY4253383.1 COX15/CtaA family protein [Flavobacteriaceae bacterium]
MKNRFRLWVQISLILVYLVITAGSIVRMTGSGMGCPDWPKCFGYIIPPTERSQLDWNPHREYKKGQIIIQNNRLLVANSSFTSLSEFSENNWLIYTKHDYAEFNVYQTYTEYINRLLGALAGLATLILFILSLGFYKSKKSLTFFSLLIVLLMGFQGWLGKVVVDSNLLPTKVSLHMVAALIIVFFLMTLYSLTWQRHSMISNIKNPWINRLLLLGFGLLIVQIGFGLQVRQIIDLQINQGLVMSDISLKQNTPTSYYQHARLGVALLILHSVLFIQFLKSKQLPRLFTFIFLLILLEVIIGLVLYHFNFPFATQPLHLLLASILLGLYFLVILDKSFWKFGFKFQT